MSFSCICTHPSGHSPPHSWHCGPVELSCQSQDRTAFPQGGRCHTCTHSHHDWAPLWSSPSGSTVPVGQRSKESQSAKFLVFNTLWHGEEKAPTPHVTSDIPQYPLPYCRQQEQVPQPWASSARMFWFPKRWGCASSTDLPVPTLLPQTAESGSNTSPPWFAGLHSFLAFLTIQLLLSVVFMEM